MLAAQLQPGQFKTYPPEARNLAVAHIQLFRQMPTVFVATLLRQIIDYDWRFPAERSEVDRQLNYLSSLRAAELRRTLSQFGQIKLDPKFEQMNWAKEPLLYSEKLTAFLWSTHQIGAFRAAGIEYMSAVREHAPVPPPPSLPRLGIAVIGKGVEQSLFPLFRKLRPHGVLFTQVQPENGLQILIDAVSTRASANPTAYGHWYIEGGTALPTSPHVSTVAYDDLQPVRAALLEKMTQVVQSGSGGPELMQTKLAALTPENLGMRGPNANSVLNRFQVNLLTQGSGTQIFSTTFVQWGAREALRRAQPITLLARFTPRQRQRPMNDLLEAKASGLELDPEGSLLDADMGAYYVWLDEQRLSDPARSSFITWFEGHNQALAIGPGLPRGTESSTPADMRRILQWVI